MAQTVCRKHLHGADFLEDASFVRFPFVRAEGQSNGGVLLNNLGDKSVSVKNLSRGRYLQLVSGSRGHHTGFSFQSMFTSTSFEGLMILRSQSVFHEAVKGKNLKVTQSCTN